MCKHMKNVRNSQACISMNFCTEFSKARFSLCVSLRWLLGLKLIQLEQQKNATSSHYFSRKFKTNTLESHKKYMKIFELEINDLHIQILAAKMK